MEKKTEGWVNVPRSSWLPHRVVCQGHRQQPQVSRQASPTGHSRAEVGQGAQRPQTDPKVTAQPWLLAT